MTFLKQWYIWHNQQQLAWHHECCTIIILDELSQQHNNSVSQTILDTMPPLRGFAAISKQFHKIL